MAWFGRNTGMGGQGPPQQPLDPLQQMAAYIDTISQSTLQTQNQLQQIAGVMHQANMASTANTASMSAAFAQLAQNAPHGGGGGSAGGSSGDQGFRALKPRKEITKITAEDAKTLMLQLDDFEVDLGELGIKTMSEAAYRQLRAMCSGKARDVLDLEIEYGTGKTLKRHLEQLLNGNAPRAAVDECGGRLYQHCVQQLEGSVRLTKALRRRIADDMYAEARMYGDGAKEAEDFLCRWRRARRLMHKENMVAPSVEEIINWLRTEVTDPVMINWFYNDYEGRQIDEMDNFMRQRVSSECRAFLLQCNPKPVTIDQCIVMMDAYIELKTKSSRQSGSIKRIGNQSFALIEGELHQILETPVAESAPTNADVGQCSECVGDPQISAFHNRQNAGYMANKQNGKFGSKASNGSTPKTGGGAPPDCSMCKGKHADVRTCPSVIAGRDAGYTPTAGQKCHWKCFGKYSCEGETHLARHHSATFVNENPGKPLPSQGGGKGGKGFGKGKSKGRFRGKKVVRVMHMLEDGTLVQDEEAEEIEYEEGEEGFDEQNAAPGAIATASPEEPKTEPEPQPQGVTASLTSEQRVEQWVTQGFAHSGRVHTMRAPGGLRLSALKRNSTPLTDTFDVSPNSSQPCDFVAPVSQDLYLDVEFDAPEPADFQSQQVSRQLDLELHHPAFCDTDCESSIPNRFTTAPAEYPVSFILANALAVGEHLDSRVAAYGAEVETSQTVSAQEDLLSDPDTRLWWKHREHDVFMRYMLRSRMHEFIHKALWRRNQMEDDESLVFPYADVSDMIVFQKQAFGLTELPHDSCTFVDALSEVEVNMSDPSECPSEASTDSCLLEQIYEECWRHEKRVVFAKRTFTSLTCFIIVLVLSYLVKSCQGSLLTNAHDVVAQVAPVDHFFPLAQSVVDSTPVSATMAGWKSQSSQWRADDSWKQSMIVSEHKDMLDDNAFFKEAAIRLKQGGSLARNDNRRRPANFRIGTGMLWCCAAEDLENDKWLDTLQDPLIVTCTGEIYKQAQEAVRRHNLKDTPVQFNVGYHHDRNRDWHDVLGEIVDALRSGRDVVLHCHAGVHRAALTTTFVIMYTKQITFAEARACIEAVRYVELDGILEPRRRQGGGWTEAHSKYVPAWQAEALRSDSIFTVNETTLDAMPSLTFVKEEPLDDSVVASTPDEEAKYSDVSSDDEESEMDTEVYASGDFEVSDAQGEPVAEDKYASGQLLDSPNHVKWKACRGISAEKMETVQEIGRWQVGDVLRITLGSHRFWTRCVGAKKSMEVKPETSTKPGCYLLTIDMKQPLMIKELRSVVWAESNWVAARVCPKESDCDLWLNLSKQERYGNRREVSWATHCAVSNSQRADLADHIDGTFTMSEEEDEDALHRESQEKARKADTAFCIKRDLDSALTTLLSCLNDGGKKDMRDLEAALKWGEVPYDGLGSFKRFLTSYCAGDIVVCAYGGNKYSCQLRHQAKPLPSRERTASRLMVPKQRPVVIVGIGGATNAGKTKLAANLCKNYNSPLRPIDTSQFLWQEKFLPRLNLSANTSNHTASGAPYSLHDPGCINSTQLCKFLEYIVEVFKYTDKVPLEINKVWNCVEPYNAGYEMPYDEPCVIVITGMQLYNLPDVCEWIDIPLWLEVPATVACGRAYHQSGVDSTPAKTPSFSTFTDIFMASDWALYLQHRDHQFRTCRTGNRTPKRHLDAGQNLSLVYKQSEAMIDCVACALADDPLSYRIASVQVALKDGSSRVMIGTKDSREKQAKLAPLASDPWTVQAALKGDESYITFFTQPIPPAEPILSNPTAWFSLQKAPPKVEVKDPCPSFAGRVKLVKDKSDGDSPPVEVHVENRMEIEQDKSQTRKVETQVFDDEGTRVVTTQVFVTKEPPAPQAPSEPKESRKVKFDDRVETKVFRKGAPVNTPPPSSTASSSADGSLATLPKVKAEVKTEADSAPTEETLGVATVKASDDFLAEDDDQMPTDDPIQPAAKKARKMKDKSDGDSPPVTSPQNAPATDAWKNFVGAAQSDKDEVDKWADEQDGEMQEGDTALQPSAEPTVLIPVTLGEFAGDDIDLELLNFVGLRALDENNGKQVGGTRNLAEERANQAEQVKVLRAELLESSKLMRQDMKERNLCAIDDKALVQRALYQKRMQQDIMADGGKNTRHWKTVMKARLRAAKHREAIARFNVLRRKAIWTDEEEAEYEPLKKFEKGMKSVVGDKEERKTAVGRQQRGRKYGQFQRAKISMKSDLSRAARGLWSCVPEDIQRRRAEWKSQGWMDPIQTKTAWKEAGWLDQEEYVARQKAAAKEEAEKVASWLNPPTTRGSSSSDYTAPARDHRPDSADKWESKKGQGWYEGYQRRK